MPAHGDPLLRLARYQPERYLVGRGDDADDTALVALLRSVLLKRFESSAEAFRQTLRRMIDQHERFLEMLVLGYLIRKEFFRELSAAEEEEEVGISAAHKIQLPDFQRSWISGTMNGSAL